MSDLDRKGRFEAAGLPDHRGKATWGSKLIPLEEFSREVERHGRTLDPNERKLALGRFLSSPSPDVEVEGPFERIAVFGGVYSNRFALEALLGEVASEVDALYCLGDLGGFGPEPELVRPFLEQAGVRCIQGNYEQSLAERADDCNCGYADPRDNHFAELSYAYTERNCSDDFRDWMGRLPQRRRIQVGQRELLAVHGSPRRVNEFLFRSTTPVAYLERLLDEQQSDGMLCTHTGIQWHRRLPSGRDAVNVGVIGRPANDGSTDVHYAVLEARDDDLDVTLRRLSYDHEGLAQAMRSESLPVEFVDTILHGWWTTCLEVLPARERAASRY